jgi:hypothetical protein
MPKDGTLVLICVPDEKIAWEGHSLRIAYWEEKYREWFFGRDIYSKYRVTHWMPLPKEPNPFNP